MNADSKPADGSTAPPASGNQKPSDHMKADSVKPDRMERSLVRDMPVGKMRPANSK